MKGNTQKTDYEGWAAFCVRQLPQREVSEISFDAESKGHLKLLRTGGFCRGKVMLKMISLGWRSEPSKTFNRKIRLVISRKNHRKEG